MNNRRFASGKSDSVKPNRQKISEKVMHLGVNLAEVLKADAIVVIAEEKINIKADIPILHVKSSNIASPRVSPDDIAIIAYMNGIDGDLIVGIVMDEIDCIVVSRDKILKRLKECTVDQNIIRAILRITAELRRGYEGKSIGTSFVVGDLEEVLKRSRQSIINPFKAHHVDITMEENWKTIEEFVQLDGAFIIDDDGIVFSAGRYMDVGGEEINAGRVGGRHMAAVSITRATNAIAITLSQDGTVEVYKDGETIVEW